MTTVNTPAVLGLNVPAAGEAERVPQAAVPTATSTAQNAIARNDRPARALDCLERIPESSLFDLVMAVAKPPDESIRVEHVRVRVRGPH
jgi:hypothetical protein